MAGREVPRHALTEVLCWAKEKGHPEELYFLDLDHSLVGQQLAREAVARHIGPVAEALNRDLHMRRLAAGEELE